MNKKTVFIAHPIGGDVQGNAKKVLAICKQVHTQDVIPVAPYLTSIQYLDDDMVEDRDLGIAANMECFHRRYIDELWLYGDCISPGMKFEVIVAFDLGIPVIARTMGTMRDMELYYQIRAKFEAQERR